MTRSDLTELFLATLMRPRTAAETVLRLSPGRETVWTGLVLVTVLAALSTGLFQMAVGVVPIGETEIILGPFSYAAVLGLSMILTAWIVSFTGQILGGTGRFEAALTLVVWLEVVALGVRVVSDLLFLVVPALGGAVVLFGLLALLWALVNFIRVLHGFPTLLRPLATLVLGSLGLAIGLSFVLAIFNVQPGI